VRAEKAKGRAKVSGQKPPGLIIFEETQIGSARRQPTASAAMSKTSQSLNPPASTPRPLTPPPASPYPPTPRHPDRGGIAVFSGGTAANFLVDVFDKITTGKKCPLRYIIPISDNGGSSSELIRVFGGPSEKQPPRRCTILMTTDLPQVSAMCEVSRCSEHQR
jgi:hypothetical protein